MGGDGTHRTRAPERRSRRQRWGLGVTVGTTMLAHVKRDAPPTTTDTSVARGERDDRTTSVCGHKLWIDGDPIPST